MEWVRFMLKLLLIVDIARSNSYKIWLFEFHQIVCLSNGILDDLQTVEKRCSRNQIQNGSFEIFGYLETTILFAAKDYILLDGIIKIFCRWSQIIYCTSIWFQMNEFVNIPNSEFSVLDSFDNVYDATRREKKNSLSLPDVGAKIHFISSEINA